MNFEILRRAGKETELFRIPDLPRPASVEVLPRGREPQNEVRVFPAAAPARGTRMWAFVVIVLTGFGLSAYIYERHLPLSQAQQARAVQGTTFEGVVKPAHEMKVAAPAAGVVTTVLVKLGDRVRQGQPLLSLENGELQAELAQAKIEQSTTAQQISQLQVALAGTGRSLVTQLAEANGRVAVLERRAQQVPTPERRESPEHARAAYERALAAFKRIEILQKEGLTSEQQYEDARAALRIAEDDLNVAFKAEAAEQALAQEQESQARLQVELSRHEQLQQLQELRSRYQKASQALRTAQERLAGGLVKAAGDGVVVELPVKTGDQVSAGMTLVRVAQLNVMNVEVEVGARIVNALHPNQRAMVVLPSDPPKEVEATIATISPVPTSTMNHMVEVQFSNAAESLWVDQPAQVRFLPE